MPSPNSLFGGYRGALLSLCTLASRVPDLSSMVEERPVLDVGSMPAHLISPELRRADPQLQFGVLDVLEYAAPFVMAVLDHLLGKGPSLTGDVQRRLVAYKGIDYPVTEEQVLILDLLSKAGRRPLTDREMKSACLQLQGVHFTGTLGNLPKPIRDIVKSKRGTGRWLET